MKKVLAILTVAFFLGGIAAPAFASNNNTLLTITQLDKDPVKEKKAEKSAESTDAKKSAECSDAKKSSECTKTEAKKDCAKTCGDAKK